MIHFKIILLFIIIKICNYIYLKFYKFVFIRINSKEINKSLSFFNHDNIINESNDFVDNTILLQETTNLPKHTFIIKSQVKKKKSYFKNLL